MKKTLLLTSFVLLSSGCASLESMSDHRVKIASEAESKISEVTGIPGTSRTAHFSDTAYLASSKNAIRYVEPLPAVFSQTITINEAATVSLSDIAERITRTTSIPVRILPDVLNQKNSSQAPAPVAAPGLPAMPAGIPSMSLPGSPFAASGATGPSAMHLSYSGGLAGLLDLVSSKNNVSWRYKDGSVELYKYVTKTFNIHAIPGTSQVAAAVGKGGSSGASGGGAGGTTSSGSTNGNTATQTTEMESTELSIWKDLEQSIKSMIGTGGQVVISQSTGTITVTDTPQVIGQVEKFISEANAIMTKQVVVHYRVLTVDNTDATRMGVNWTSVFNAMNKNSGVSLASMALPHAAAGSAILSALIPATATGGMSQLAGSNVLIDALETQGRVSRVTSGALTTLNNQPAPVQVVNEKSYIASVSAQQTANVGSATAITPGKVVTGFSMNLLPHILEDDRILMQYSINLSSLNALVERTSGASTIQTPEIDTRSSMQKVSMRAGETLILSGFERTGLSTNNTGGVIQGGGKAANEDKAVVVILITPVLTDG